MKKNRKESGGKLLGVLLALAMIVGLFPGMSLTAYAADDPYASLKYTTTVITFDGKPWYLIDYDAGTVTLLAKNCVGSSPYNESGSFVEYNNSPTVKTAVDKWYDDNITADAQTAVSGDRMFLLTKDQANAITNAEVRRDVTAYKGVWWLCSQGLYDDLAAFVYGGAGFVDVTGLSVIYKLGVRPALKLNLSSVIFSSESNTFSLKSSHTHSFTYAADGATITATCTADGCTLPESSAGAGDHVATLTISANGGTYDGTTAYGATITDANSIQGDAKIMYAAGRTASQQSGAPAQAQVPDAQVSVMNDDPFGLYTE